MLILEWIATIDLLYRDECRLLGITPDLTIYVEEIYGEDDWLAQHAIASDGTHHVVYDEDFGHKSQFTSVALPSDCIPPAPPMKALAEALNFSGPRLKGQREFERIAEAAYPLTVQQKLQIVEQFSLNMLPLRLLGLTESHLLAAAALPGSGEFLVCRRLRVAHALETPQVDTKQQTYDYDSATLYVAHLYDPQIAPDLVQFPNPPGIAFARPMDCLIFGDRLVVAEGGTPEKTSCVHILRLAHNPVH